MENDRAAVGRFVALARTHAGGSGEKLAQALAPWLEKRTNRSTVDAWARGENDPPAWLLFRMAREWGLSLDEFALADEDRRSLQEQLRELRKRQFIIVSYLNRLLQAHGERIDFDENQTALGQ